MSDQDDIIEAPQDAAEESGPDNFFIDILTGNKENATDKKLLVQKVLRQLDGGNLLAVQLGAKLADG